MKKGILLLGILFLMHCASTYTTEIGELEKIKPEKDSKVLIYTKSGEKIYLEEYQYVNERVVGTDGLGQKREIQRAEIKKAFLVEKIPKGQRVVNTILISGIISYLFLFVLIAIFGVPGSGLE